MNEITFKEFRELMAKRKRTVDDLVDLFRGKIEDPREFFERVISCRYKGEDRGNVVVPYRSVIEFYRQEFAYLKDSEEEERKSAVKRKRPVSEERKAVLRKQAEMMRAAQRAKRTSMTSQN